MLTWRELTILTHTMRVVRGYMERRKDFNFRMDVTQKEMRELQEKLATMMRDFTGSKASG